MARQKLHTAAAATDTGGEMQVNGAHSVAVQVSGTFSGTLAWKGTLDGANWVALMGKDLTNGTQAVSETTVGIYAIAVGGLRGFRAEYTHSSGAVTVIAERSHAGHPALTFA